MVAWSSAWLIVLSVPANGIYQGHDHPAAVAALLLAAFIVLYLWLLWVAADPTQSLRLKLAMLAPLAAIALGGSLAYRESWIFLFFFLAAAVACALPERRALFGILAVTIVDAIVAIRTAYPGISVGPQIFGVAMTGVVVMVILRMVRLIGELNAAREELARLAVADERLRFARDLHDLLGHTLSLIVVKSEAVRRLVHNDVDAAARESGDIEMVSRQALAEVREAVTNYRDRSLESELEGAHQALTAAGIEATIHRPDEPMPDTIESLLGWTVREGVTNVVRHSRGRHCEIDLREVDGVAVLQICDDGEPDVPASTLVAPGTLGTGAANRGEGRVPMNAADDRLGAGGRRVGGSGLRGLAERLAATNGRLEAGRQPGGGFRLKVTVPLNPDGRGTV